MILSYNFFFPLLFASFQPKGKVDEDYLQAHFFGEKKKNLKFTMLRYLKFITKLVTVSKKYRQQIWGTVIFMWNLQKTVRIPSAVNILVSTKSKDNSV